jgi:Spy/CpxP family protein refolding chaperone
MKNTWKLIILLTGIFLAGAATGTLVTMRVLKRPPAPAPTRPPPSAELWTTQHLKRLVEELGVQPEQLEQIKPIVSQRMAEQFRLRGRFLDENRAVRIIMEGEVAGKLNPEQRAKYEQMNREYHERMRKMERGERLPPKPDRPPEK